MRRRWATTPKRAKKPSWRMDNTARAPAPTVTHKVEKYEQATVSHSPCHMECWGRSRKGHPPTIASAPCASPVRQTYKMGAPRSHSRRARASMLQRTSMNHFRAQRGDRMERYRHRLPRFGSHPHSVTAEGSIGATLHTTASPSHHFHSPPSPRRPRAQQLLQTWQDSHPQHNPCIIGADWNETFNTQLQTATTSRGEIILGWMSTDNQHMPLQQDNIPSYHPYSKAMRSRRIDYSSRKMVRHLTRQEGSPDAALGDHDAIMAEIITQPHMANTKQPFTHHPMKIKMLGARIPPPPPGGTPLGQPHPACSQHRRSIPRTQIPGKQAAQESQTQAGVRPNPDGPENQHWKLIQAARKRDRQQWDQAQAVRAAKGDCQAHRQSKDKPQQFLWGQRLLSDSQWEHQMTAHFESICKQQPAKQLQSEFSRMRSLLDRQCKLAPYQPVTVDELNEIQDKWGKKKATGPDRVFNEALRFFLAHDNASAKLVWVLDDAIYKRHSPSHGHQDITVLLATTAHHLERHMPHHPEQHH